MSLRTQHHLLDAASYPAISTPTDATEDRDRRQAEFRRFLSSIHFDAADNPIADRAMRRTVPTTNMSTDWKTSDDVSHWIGPRKTQMKPGKFDENGSLESFFAQFEVCARHSRWTCDDKVDFMRCALEKAATQQLWDFGAREDVTYELLLE